MPYKTPPVPHRFQPGNKFGGRTFGARSLSTIIRDVMEDGIDWEKMPVNADTRTKLNERYGKRGWEAVIYVMTAKALAGDVKAAEFLAKHGYRQQIDITTAGKELPTPILGGISTNAIHSNDSTEKDSKA
jgi:hypothetical protein